MGLMLKAIQQELTAVDDRTFKWVLKKPYPKMLLALGKNSTPMAFIMPERIAKTDPFKQIDEYVGSGPMKFAKGEWVPGAKAVFEKFADYQPRQEKASWLAGGKKMLVDRIEWVIMPDPATASAALQNGEVDWWENPISDLVPVLKRNRNVAVDIADPLGNIGTFRMNHLHPPFNDVRARRAVLMALDQEEYMRALVGDDNSLWKPLPGYFTPDTPLYNEEGGEILKGKRDIAGAKKLLAESGYTNQPVTCVVAQDQPITKGQGDVTAELLKRIGMNVDFVATDWGTTGQRRAQKSPPGQGGWAMFHSWHAGADCINPAVYIAIRASGDGAWFGWPNVPEVEKEVANWFDAKNARRGKGRRAPSQQGGARQRRVRADRLLPHLSGVAQERQRHREGPDARSSGTWPRARDRAVASAHVHVRRQAYSGDHPGHGGGRALRVQPAVHRAGRSGRGDRRRPGDAAGRRAHPPEPRARPAVPGAVLRLGMAARCTSISAGRSSPTCRSPP